MMPDSLISQAGIPSPTDGAIVDVVDRWVAASQGDPAAALAAVVASVARVADVDVALSLGGEPVDADPSVVAVALDAELAAKWGPWLPGFVLESLLSGPDRRRRGVHHTSPAVAEAVVTVALGVAPLGNDAVVGDPAVGGGVFLLAACEAMKGSRADCIARVVGCDIDPLAAGVTEAALRLWAGGAAVPDGRIRAVDFLAPQPFASTPDLIVGNPPFLSQLKGETTRSAAGREDLRDRWPGVGGYVDTSAAFLLAATDAVTEGGVVALLQPSSFLSARDSQGVREHLGDVAPLAALWIDGERRFEADVDTVAVVARRGEASRQVDRVVGLPGAALEPFLGDLNPRSWAPVLADTLGVPALENSQLESGLTLGDVAVVTSGFRDQFYGLRGAISEGDGSGHRLITSGLIDPLEVLWGSRSCRFDKQRWHHPVVDIDAIDPAISDWFRTRLVPKLLVSSQTRTVEVIVDESGLWVPCTPVISVEPRPGAPSLWHLAAALTSPVAAVVLLREAAGSALSADAMRVSAPRLGELSMPPAGPKWDRAARLSQLAHADPSADRLAEVGAASLDAYGLADRDDLLAWWVKRLPRRAIG